ncbi:unnamed protein product [Sphagnum troendelagicum]|uniref:E3 ubiquitin-protein ligase FANCL n=1 Tax=Sphagnum troendelagicum TaxID=128251 RepID=A0ABP0UJL3_9BRYO
MATVLPLNAQLTAFQVFLPVQGKEYEFGLHNVPSPEEAGKVSLRNAKLDCKLELRMLLEGFEHVLQERMKQSLDVATFVEEFKDILDRIVQAQPQVVLPPASFYARIVAEIEAIGWEHVAWISPQLTTLHLCFFDVAGREHIVHVNLPPDYPEKQPLATADLPIAVELRWGPDGTMNAILSQFQLAAERFQDFWANMEDIDKHVWVMEPEHPSRANCFRRIALGGHCSLSITVNPLSPRSIPEYRFFGSDALISPIRKRMDSCMSHWYVMDRLLRINLEDVLELTFPCPQDTDQDDISANCIICYNYRLPHGTGDWVSKEGLVPDRVCDNGSCGRPFHSACLVEWLRAIPTTRQSFDVLFGSCPCCSHPIMVKCTSG